VSDAGARLREGDLLTVAQARKLVPLARATFYALIESGELPCYRFGAAWSRTRRVLVHRGDLEAFVARARHGATRAPTAPDVDALLSRVRARRRGVGPPNPERA
jgi:excisionase family DNA binding protein